METEISSDLINQLNLSLRKNAKLSSLESLICVFCGKQQRTSDNAPDPIKLTSTSAYKWFLTSLDLDGSEMVEAMKEMSGSRYLL
ncbi:unnamed protein product [Brassica rapa subsp. narinosa]